MLTASSRFWAHCPRSQTILLPPSRYHRLGQIVIEVLLGICVLGVELANASVGHLSHHDIVR